MAESTFAWNRLRHWGLALAVVTTLLPSCRSQKSRHLSATIADLQTVHQTVTANDREIRGVARVAEGHTVVTQAEGLARARLDDGTALLLDRNTRLRLGAKQSHLLLGRAFASGARGARHELVLAGVTVFLGEGRAGLEAGPKVAKIYAAAEELTLRNQQGEQKLRAGETASITEGRVSIAPEVAFDDWTSGLSAPWAAEREPRRALGELWGITGDPGSPGSPLTLRSHDIKVNVTGEFAETTLTTVFFNGGAKSVSGDFRMALPPGAIVSRFAWATGAGSLNEGTIAVSTGDGTQRFPGGPVLEWAGEGWVRGFIPGLASGTTATVVVSYAEWLEPQPGQSSRIVEVRTPLLGEGEPVMVGEFSGLVDASASFPLSMASGQNAVVSGPSARIRRSDFFANSDWVTTIEQEDWSAPARAYRAPAAGDTAGDTILVRTELPMARAAEGATLALVVDLSSSIDPALFDTAQSVVESILNGLGTGDRAILIGADEAPRFLGENRVGPVTTNRKKALLDALAKAQPGGATDLGLALEAAADALPPDAPSGMVVYVGDGWPTLGDTTLSEIEARLRRRHGGVPRLAAVALGSAANRPLLAALTRASGPLVEVGDRSQASAAAVRLMVEALRPTYANVEVLFDPTVERIYPRSPRAVRAGGTVWATGRIREGKPQAITLRWHASDGPHQETRKLAFLHTTSPEDVRRRWAQARYDEILLSGKGRQAAIDVALRAGLMSPFTSLTTSGQKTYTASSLGSRLLDLSPVVVGLDSSSPSRSGSLLATITAELAVDGVDPDMARQQAVTQAIRRRLAAATAAVRACRDARTALRPELEGSLVITVTVNTKGRAERVRVQASAPTIDDPLLLRCVENVIGGLDFPVGEGDGPVTAEYNVELPLAMAVQARRCSALSRLPMPARRGAWRELLQAAGSDAAQLASVFFNAKSSCELLTFTEKQALCELLLDVQTDPMVRLNVADRLQLLGESDAADWLNRETTRRASSPAELARIRQRLRSSESYPIAAFERSYQAAGNDRARRDLVVRTLSLAPHDTRLLSRLSALLASMGDQAGLTELVRNIEADPFAEAILLTELAEALHGQNRDQEARRVFGGLIERAPADPWARAFLGDRLRNLGWNDEASATYQALERLAPDHPAALLRLALAHQAAGRLDIAQRQLRRIIQTGGRSGDAGFGQLATDLLRLFLVEAMKGASDPAEAERLRMALGDWAPSSPEATLLLRIPASSCAVQAKLAPPAQSGRKDREATTLADGLGIYSMHFDPVADSGARLTLQRSRKPPPAAATPTRLDVVIPGGASGEARMVTRVVPLPISGDQVVLTWKGNDWE